MALSFLHFNYGRTTASGVHPDWRRDTDTVTHLTTWKAMGRDFEGWREGGAFGVGDRAKAIRRIVGVPVAAATTYLIVFLEAGAYFLKWYGPNRLRGRLQQFRPQYETSLTRTNPQAYDVEGSYFANGVNTKFSGDEVAGNLCDPNEATGFTLGDVSGGAPGPLTPTEVTPNTLAHFAMDTNEIRRVWVPKLMKIGFATVTAQGDLGIETAG
jgi:hypothetical protein